MGETEGLVSSRWTSQLTGLCHGCLLRILWTGAPFAMLGDSAVGGRCVLLVIDLLSTG